MDRNILIHTNFIISQQYCISQKYRRFSAQYPGIESRSGRDFPHPSRPSLGPTQPPLQWVPSLSRGVNRPGSGADHPPPHVAEVKERTELYVYSPSVSSWLVIGWTLSLPLPVCRMEIVCAWNWRWVDAVHPYFFLQRGHLSDCILFYGVCAWCNIKELVVFLGQLVTPVFFSKPKSGVHKSVVRL